MEQLTLENGGFVFKWHLDNFSFLHLESGTIVESPYFAMDPVSSGKWRICLEINSERFLDIVLQRSSSDAFRLNGKLEITTDGSEYLEYDFQNEFGPDPNDTSYTLPVFHLPQSRKFFIQKNVLLTFSFYPPSSRDSTDVIVCTARSYIEVNKLQDRAQMKSYSSFKPRERISHQLPLTWVEGSPDICLIFTTRVEDGTARDFEIFLMQDHLPNESDKYFSMDLTVTFTNLVGGIIGTTQVCCVFPSASPLEFPPMRNENARRISEYMADDVFVVKLDFTMSTGRVFSFIESSEVIPTPLLEA